MKRKINPRPWRVMRLPVFKDCSRSGGEINFRHAQTHKHYTLKSEAILGGLTHVGRRKEDNGKEVDHFNFRYRYWLSYVFDPTKPLLYAVMLNPSTATHRDLDPTMKRLITRAIDEGYGGVVAVNVYAFRATKPRDLPVDLETAKGRYNHWYVRYAVRKSRETGGLIFCGWGSHKRAQQDCAYIKNIANDLGTTLHAYYVNDDGSPKHPLYIAAKHRPVVWYEPGTCAA